MLFIESKSLMSDDHIVQINWELFKGQVNLIPTIYRERSREIPTSMDEKKSEC